MRVIRKRQPQAACQRVFADGLKRLRFDGVARIETNRPDETGHEGKKYDAIKTGDLVTDYQNVSIRGYLSTFQGTTASDRQGDYVKPGAFAATIPQFMQNPVLLVDHDNDCESAVGHFTKVKEDDKGLYVEAVLSNCPCDDCKHVRFAVAEGALRTMSMGGVFIYDTDGRGIKEVQLFEGSLTPIPVNPDATFSTRALTQAEAERVRVNAT